MTYETMMAAIHGSPFALQEILRHYDSYINHYSYMPVLGPDGKVFRIFDADAKGIIQAELMLAILDFVPEVPKGAGK